MKTLQNPSPPRRLHRLVRRHVKELHIYHKIVLRNLELQEEINKIAAVLQAHMTALKLEGLRGNQVALQAFIDVDEMWRELFDCSIEDDERGKTPNTRTQPPPG